ncbi:DUF3263 domain-containing protein [Pimelobacter simplex]|uniref:DUF3263 domain-containing protein n=1 Tax=Nocardioides simplex TaxID=2045 RepID=A0A7J5DSQ8_NOCSI|nr:DUF3263 domain-containing protein [Pimelobacter simplex]
MSRTLRSSSALCLIGPTRRNERPEALAFDPVLVKRLRRLRSDRQRQRSARRLGFAE